MPNTPVRKVDGVHFVEKNETFFLTPLKNPDQFRKFYEDEKKINEISDYSQKFMAVLQKTIHTEGKYSGPAIIWWQKGEFEKVLEHPEVRQFIIDNQEHPALVAWQEKHPPRDLSPPPSLSEEEIKVSQEIVNELMTRLENAKEKLINYRDQLNVLQTNKPNEQTKSDHICLCNAISYINNSLRILKSAQIELLGQNGRPIPLEIKSKFAEVEQLLSTNVKENLLKVEDKHIKGRVERILNALSKILGFSGYKSQETIQAEERSRNLGKLGQQLPATMENAALSIQKTREFREHMNQRNNETPTLDKGYTQNTI